jgi:hypothetical protein
LKQRAWAGARFPRQPQKPSANADGDQSDFSRKSQWGKLPSMMFVKFNVPVVAALVLKLNHC